MPKTTFTPEASVRTVLEGLDYRSPTAVGAAMARYEKALEDSFTPVVQKFLEGVQGDATSALAAPVLLAAGGPRAVRAQAQPRTTRGRFVADPFSFTQVRRRWMDAVRQLADLADLPMTDQFVQDALIGANLPHEAFVEVQGILTTSRREEWSEHQTKRALSKALIPKESSGKWDSRAKYRNSVRTMARTVATGNFNYAMEKDLAWQGYTTKIWHAHQDDRVRHTHDQADGQEVSLGSSFRVGAALLRYPGDKTGPVSEVVNCRCHILGGEHQ